LLTHHHRDTARYAAECRAKKAPARAAKESADYPEPEKVAKFWKESVPLRNSRTEYFVLPEGVEGIEARSRTARTLPSVRGAAWTDVTAPSRWTRGRRKSNINNRHNESDLKTFRRT
jgi:hypothetical protein